MLPAARAAIASCALGAGATALALACGTQATSPLSPEAGAAAEAAPPDLCRGADPGAVPAPSGGGYCCPILATNCSGPPSGGWASSAKECCGHRASPDLSFTQKTDSHGCPVLVEDPTHCCLCPYDAGIVDTFTCGSDASTCNGGSCPAYWKEARQCATWDPQATVALFPYCKERIVRVTLGGASRYYVYSNGDLCAFTGTTAAFADGGVDDSGLPSLHCDGTTFELEESCVRSLLDPAQGFPCANSAYLVPYCEQAP